MSEHSKPEPLWWRLRAVDRVEIIEDNAGGIHLYLPEQDLAVVGMDARDALAVTDCALLHNWIDDIPEAYIHTGRPQGEVVAEWRYSTARLTPETDYPGTAARTYCKLWED